MMDERKKSLCYTFPYRPHDRIIPVGWLDANRPCDTGETDRRVFERLQELLKSPWQPIDCIAGPGCKLCQFESEADGTNILCVPSEQKVFVAPELIVHYINAHQFKPSQDFCEAVLNCPPMRSQAYRAAMSNTGLLAELRKPIQRTIGTSPLDEGDDCQPMVEDSNQGQESVFKPMTPSNRASTIR